MRVRLSTNPPLPALKAWFPLHDQTSTVYTFKSLLCTSLGAVRGISPSSLHLVIDGFELLDQSELTVIRDGDLISIGLRERVGVKEAIAPRATSAATRKRKRHVPTSTSSSSGFESDTEESSTESESESDTSDSGSGSDSGGTKGKVQPQKRTVAAPSTPLQRTVPPGYGKPQTRARNRRRRLKRMHEHEVVGVPEGGPVSGANAVAPDPDVSFATGNGDPHAPPTLMSLSLRNKNKAKNFKSLMNKPLPAKIIFDDQEGASTAVTKTQTLPRLIPPSSRSSLPENLFVTSVNVETPDEPESPELEMDVGIDKLESHANENWAMLEKLTREQDSAPGTLVGYKAFGVDPVTCTPGHVLTVARVVSRDVAVLVIHPIRSVSFLAEENTEHPWEEIECGEWRLL